MYFNVPAGYAQLVPALEADPAFAGALLLPAAADVQRRRRAARGAAGPAGRRRRSGPRAARSRSPASWGATETAPAVTAAHFDFADARCIGVPLPGAEVKLVPAEGGYEIRARGPMVTPGYFGRPDLTAQAFDDDGLLPLRGRGRAGRPGRPQRRAGLPGPDRRGLQAHHRHVRAGRARCARRCCPPRRSWPTR